MTATTKPTWERFGDAMLDWGGYLLLVVATALGTSAGDPDPAWRLTTLAIAVAAGAWIFVGWTRRPPPDADHRVRLAIFFVGLVALASVLMVRQPLFFVFMIAGFFYATALRPMWLAVIGIGTTSVLVNSLIMGLPRTSE